VFDFTPAQISQFSLIGSLAGMATGAIGSYYSSQSKASSLSFQADMDALNAQQSERQAQHALYQGDRQAGKVSLQYGQVKASQRAGMAANGVDLGTGSAAEVQASTDLAKEMDMNTIAQNATMSAWGFRTQALNYSNQSKISRAMAGSISPIGSAFTSMLGSAGSVASSWYRYSKESNSPAPAKQVDEFANGPVITPYPY
jgi:hypothetical protein